MAIHAEGHDAHVADAGVGDQFLEIGLRHGDQGAVHHADNAEQCEFPREVPHRIREDREADPQETVCAHFQEDACQDDADGCRRFHVCIGQPCVERE